MAISLPPTREFKSFTEKQLESKDLNLKPEFPSSSENDVNKSPKHSGPLSLKYEVCFLNNISLSTL